MNDWRGSFAERMKVSKSIHVGVVDSYVIVIVLVVLLNVLGDVACIGEIIFAVNAGGDAHTDIHGVTYQRDPLHGKTGTASDYGKQLLVGRVPPADIILYQTERYHLSTFGYDVPIKEDGDYVLVLKFCEVYFTAPNMKVGPRYFPVRYQGEC